MALRVRQSSPVLPSWDLNWQHEAPAAVRVDELREALTMMYRFNYPGGRTQWHVAACAVWLDAPCSCGKDFAERLGIR